MTVWREKAQIYCPRNLQIYKTATKELLAFSLLQRLFIRL